MNNPNDYRNIDKVISKYNQSIESYNLYLLGKSGIGASQFQEHLNDAGEKIYECYEAALKNVLERYYKGLLSVGSITQSVYDSKKNLIERSNRPGLETQFHGCSVSTSFQQSIDYSLIDSKARDVTNKKKHELRDVNEIDYLAVQPEIRKFIISYLSSDARLSSISNIKEEKSPIDLLLKLTSNFNNDDCDYILLADSVQELTSEQKQAICLIDWNLVFDFDSNSINNGLNSAYSLLKKNQPTYIGHKNLNNYTFDVYSSPYWFFIKGRTDISESLTTDPRQWNRLYGRYLPTLVENFHKVFEKKAVVVVAASDPTIVKKIIESFDTYYENELEIILLNEHDLSSYPYTNINKCFMSLVELSLGLQSFGALFGDGAPSIECLMPGNDGSFISVSENLFPHLELVYQDIHTKVPEDVDKDKIDFLQGRKGISWYGVANGFAITRNKAATNLKKIIEKNGSNNNYHEITHVPGIGGSTFAKVFAYEIRKDKPVCFLNTYVKDSTTIQINNLYNIVRNTIIIFIDSSVLTQEQVTLFRREMGKYSFPYFIFYVRREKSSIQNDLEMLDDIDCQQMVIKLLPYASDDIKEHLNIIHSKYPTERSPFYMSLLTFEEKYSGIESYIKHFLDEKDNEANDVLLYVSLADVYTFKPISSRFFNSDVQNLRKLSYQELLVKENRKSACYFRIRHSLFAKEIIRQLLEVNEKNESLTLDSIGTKYVNKLIQFIKLSKTNLTIEYDSIIEVLNNMFIIRDDNELNRGKFSPLIEHIRSLSANEADGNNRAGMIFKELVQCYPENPHFLAHLSRFYTYVEKNYDEGIHLAEEAIILNESTKEGYLSASLYHINGMAYKKRVLDYWKNEIYSSIDSNLPIESLVDDMLSDVDRAIELFEKSITFKNQDIGYQAAIDLCIEVIDIANFIFKYDSVAQLLSTENDPWCKRYIEKAAELFLSWEAEDPEDKMTLETKVYGVYGDLKNMEKIITEWNHALQIADSDNIFSRRKSLMYAINTKATRFGFNSLSESDKLQLIELSKQTADDSNRLKRNHPIQRSLNGLK